MYRWLMVPALTLISLTTILPHGSASITGLANAKAVRSVQHGALKIEVHGGATIVRLPLDVADMLLIDR